MCMLEEFVKYMASLSEFEREQKMDILMNLFAPSPSHDDFKRLKGAVKRRDKRIRQLEAEVHKLEEAKTRKPTFEELYKSICRSPNYLDLQRRILAAQLYRMLANQHMALRRKNKVLQSEIERLVYRLHHPEQN